MSLDVGRTSTDALRSLKRYAAIAFGDAWEVRLSREEGAFERPFARVWQVAGTTYPLTGGKWLADMVQPFVISTYPPRGATPDDALLSAQAVEKRSTARSVSAWVTASRCACRCATTRACRTISPECGIRRSTCA